MAYAWQERADDEHQSGEARGDRQGKTRQNESAIDRGGKGAVLQRALGVGDGRRGGERGGGREGHLLHTFQRSEPTCRSVADELIRSFDELIQPFRLSISDPLLRIAFGCDAFFQKALEDRLWASLAARMARSYPAVGKSRGNGSLKTCARRSSNLRKRNCRWSLLSKCRLGSSFRSWRRSATDDSRMATGPRPSGAF